MKFYFSKALLKRVLTIIIFLSISYTGFSQSVNADSLRNIWNDVTQLDSVRLEAHGKLIYSHYLYNAANADSALIMIEENIAYAKKKGSFFSQGKAFTYLGIYHDVSRANNKEALRCFEQAHDLYGRVNNINSILESKHNIARCHFSMGDAKAFQKYKEVETFALEHNRPKYVLYAKNWFGSHYSENGSIDIAMDYFKDAIKIAQEINMYETEASIYIWLGMIEEKARNFEAAKGYFEQAHQINQKIKYSFGLIYSYSNLARMYSVEGDSAQALDYYKKSLTTADSINDVESKMVVFPEVIKFYLNRKDTISAKPYVTELQKLGEASPYPPSLVAVYLYSSIIERFEGNYEAALDYCKKARKILIQSKINKDLQEVCNCIYESERKLGNDKAALIALEEYMTIRDTLFNEDRELSFATLTAEYKYEKEKEITDANYQANLERQSLIQKGLMVGLGLLGLLAFFIFRGYRNKQKANELLATKNQEIESQKEQLEQLNQTKDRIFAILGHDMRKPTLAFRGIARKVNYLLKKKDFNRLEQLGESIERDALGLNNLTDNLLNWALTQKNTLPHHPEQIQLSPIIKEVFLTLGRLAEDKNIHLKSEISDETMVMADKNALLTIIRNLVDNAIKFTPENGNVIISSQPSNVGVDVFIKDTGIGMDAEKSKSIFLLQKGKSTKGTSGEKGTGLGLHLVHELVKLNEGNITVVSQQGEGTEFCVSLKAA